MISIFFSHLNNDDETILAAREAGLEGADCSYEDLMKRPAADMKKYLFGRGLLCGAVFGTADVSPEDEGKFAEGLFRARKMISDAGILGAENVMLVPGFASDVHDKERAAARMAEGLSTLASEAAAVGITLSIENFSQLLTPYSTPLEIISMLSSAPGLRYTLDTGNFRCRSIQLPDAVETLLPRIARVHAKDWGSIRRGSDAFIASDGTELFGAPLGKGMLPLREACKTIRGAGYRGDWCIEMNCMRVTKDDVIESVKFMRDIIS